MKLFFRYFVIYFFFLLMACSSMRTKSEADTQISTDLAAGNFEQASERIEQYRQKKIYQKKDRVLYYLNKGLVLHYQKEFSKSNENLERADFAMEELFTRSISKALLSAMMNDNVLDYSGEIYDEIYVNIFKTLNFIGLNDFEGAYVEIKRLNDKLQQMDAKYGEWVDKWNDDDTTGIQIEKKATGFYEDALANYLSYLIFRADGEDDNARISHENVQAAWQLYPEVYNFPKPEVVQDDPQYGGTFLNILAFTGQSPRKVAVGGKITTFENFIIISDPAGQKNKIWLNLPGLEEGWHFKFSFPEMKSQTSAVNQIKVFIDGEESTELQLLEDMGKVAKYTFETKKHIIYFKTITRTVVKGITAHKAKEKLKKETKTKDNFILRNIINLGVDAIFDATENPDLRIWSSLPRYCYAGEIKLPPGLHDIRIQFIGRANLMLTERIYADYTVGQGLNLIESFYLD
jgi:hypothetical protein